MCGAMAPQRKQKCNKEIPCQNCTDRGVRRKGPGQLTGWFGLMILGQTFGRSAINAWVRFPIGDGVVLASISRPSPLQRLYVPGQSAIPKDPRRSHRRLSTPPAAGGMQYSPPLLPRHGSGGASGGANSSDRDRDEAFRAEMRARMDRLEQLLVGQAGRGQGVADGRATWRHGTREDSPLRGRHAEPSQPASQSAYAPDPVPATSLGITPALRLLIKTSGVAPSRLTELVRDLPPYTRAHALIERFITVINVIRYPVHAPSLREAVAAVYAKRERSGHGSESAAELGPADVRNLPLIYIVLAISARNAPSEGEGEAEKAERATESVRLYWGCEAARHAIGLRITR